MEKLENIPNVDELLAFDLTEMDPPVRDVWSELSDGTISANEARMWAREFHPDLSEEDLELRVRAFAPPSPETFANELKLVLLSHQEQPEARDVEPSGSPVPEPEEATPEPIPLRRPSSRLRTTGTAAAGLAAAAALVFALQTDENPSNTGSSTELASYTVELDGWKGEKLGHGDPPASSNSEEWTLIKDRLKVTLRPETTIDASADLHLKAWARSEDGTTTRQLALEFEVNEHGIIRVDQSISSRELPPGRWTITFVVGLSAILDDISRLDEISENPSDGLWSGRKRVRVVK